MKDENKINFFVCFVLFYQSLNLKENPTASWEIISERKPELHHGK
jgi:hypothetical protein